MAIHPTAIVDKAAEIDPSAEVGAYAVVERNVRIGPDVRLYPHAYVAEGTTLGAGCQIHPFAVVGHMPQDLKFSGEPTYLDIGENTVVREHASIHRGTEPGSRTVVGRSCYIMSTGHIGHNCTVGDHVIVANTGLVSGHVKIGDRAFISGCVVVHQHLRIGELAMLGGMTAVSMDVPPFMLVGKTQCATGLNLVGLRRAGFSKEELKELKEVHRIVFRSRIAFRQAVEQVAEIVKTEPGRRLVEFLRAPTDRGVIPGPRDAGDSENEEAT